MCFVTPSKLLMENTRPGNEGASIGKLLNNQFSHTQIRRYQLEHSFLVHHFSFLISIFRLFVVKIDIDDCFRGVNDNEESCTAPSAVSQFIVPTANLIIFALSHKNQTNIFIETKCCKYFIQPSNWDIIIVFSFSRNSTSIYYIEQIRSSYSCLLQTFLENLNWRKELINLTIGMQ